MTEILDFIKSYPLFTITIAILDFILVFMIVTKIIVILNKNVQDAKAGRGEKKDGYKKYMDIARKTIEGYERKNNKANFYKKAIQKTRQAGYYGEHAAVKYLMLVYVVPAFMFIVTFIVNFPNLKNSFFIAIVIPIIVESTIKAKRKSIVLQFQKSSYKIYKYLHNQISAGIGVPEAIQSIYEVTDDAKLRHVLMNLASAFGRTKDIDYALKEFETYFDIQEAQTLAVALRQGIETGDNQNILEKQEEVMFDKYVDYIQAETDAMKNRTTIAVIFFVAIIVVMISVPLYNDMVQAISKIFVN